MTREEVINEIKQIQCFDKPFDNSVEECNKFAKREIALNRAIKALEQEPKIGHWEEKNVRGFTYPYCSECGNGLDVIYHYPFCPYCGAKMESEGLV